MPRETQRTPTDLVLSRIDSPIGAILVVTDAEGAVRALDFHDYEARLFRLLNRRWGEVAPAGGSCPAVVARRIEAYFDGELSAFDGMVVRSGGTAFQQAVWTGLRAIPAGETRTYGELATAMGRPSAVRAVGLANGANPIAIAVPCHRVIGASGALTGYAGGLERKAWLLDHERRHAVSAHRIASAA